MRNDFRSCLDVLLAVLALWSAPRAQEPAHPSDASPKDIAALTDLDRLDEVLAELEGAGAEGVEKLVAVLRSTRPETSVRRAVLGAISRAGEAQPLRTAELMEEFLPADRDEDPAVLRCYADVVPYLEEPLDDARMPIYGWLHAERRRAVRGSEWVGELDRLFARREAPVRSMDIDYWHAQLAGPGQSVFDIERAADWCRSSLDLARRFLPQLTHRLRERVGLLGYVPTEGRHYSFMRAEIRVRLAHALLAVDPQGQDRVMALAVMLRLHESPRVRRAAAGQLCEVGSDDALTHLVEHLLVETSPSVVDSIASRLGERLSESPELSEAVEAARERVREARGSGRRTRRGV